MRSKISAPSALCRSSSQRTKAIKRRASGWRRKDIPENETARQRGVSNPSTTSAPEHGEAKHGEATIKTAKGNSRPRDARVQARRTSHPGERPQGQESKAGDRDRASRGGRLQSTKPEAKPPKPEKDEGQGAERRDGAG